MVGIKKRIDAMNAAQECGSFSNISDFYYFIQSYTRGRYIGLWAPQSILPVLG